MKKAILLFVLVFAFACSSDDENKTNPIQEDPIVAEWQFGKVIYLYKDGTKETREPTACDLQSSYYFLPDNTIQLTSYISDNNGGCEYEVANYEYHTWEKISAGKYVMTSKHPGETEELNTINAEFPDGKTMIWTEDYSNEELSDVLEIKNYFNKIQ